MTKRILLVLLAAALICATGCKLIDRFIPALVSDEPTSQSPSETEDPTEEVPDNSEAVTTPRPTEEYDPDEDPALTEVPVVPTEVPSIVTSAYKCRVNRSEIRTSPDMRGEVVGYFGYEDRVNYICDVGTNVASILYNDSVCYCYSSHIVPAKEKLYGYMPPQYQYAVDENGRIVYDENGAPKLLKSELIDIRLVVPDVEVYQILGTKENFTGVVQYKRPVPVLQVGTAKKLAAAAKRFAEDGYRIKIYDCYRPKSVQYVMYDLIQNSAYIANPYKSASNHNRAAAVDMTLIGPDGKELSFPTPMHTFKQIVYRSSRNQWTAEQRKNVDYMTNVMLESGFKLINTEWWHFSDTDYPDYIVLDVDMRDIPMYTARQLGYGK